MLTTVLFFSWLSTASAVQVINDFEDGTLQGWRQGRRAVDPLTIATEANGNKYMVLESFGPRSGRHPDPNSKIASFGGDQWEGTVFNGMNVFFADMINFGDTDVPITIAIADKDGFTSYTSNKSVVLEANGEWTHIEFQMVAEDFDAHALDTNLFPETPFDIGLEYTSLFRIYSAEDGFHPDKIVAKLGLDNLGVAQVDLSEVPVPAAFWLFVSGVIGLRGIATRSLKVA